MREEVERVLVACDAARTQHETRARLSDAVIKDTSSNAISTLTKSYLGSMCEVFNNQNLCPFTRIFEI